MDIFQAIVLGIVQGLTEFIPVSSSAHLVIVRHLFGWPDTGLLFDVMLHLGTLLAALIYFRKDLWNLATRIFARDVSLQEERAKHRRLLVNLAIATVPGAVAGFFLEDAIGTMFRNDIWIGVFLIALAGIFFGVERWAKKHAADKDMFKMSWVDAALVGLAQMVALLPGISRSGSTISVGLLRRVNRAEATRFSFLMSLPIIAGAGLNGLREYLSGKGGEIAGAEVAWGFLASAVVGYISIAFLIQYLKRHSLNVFAVYVLVVGVLLLIFG